MHPCLQQPKQNDFHKTPYSQAMENLYPHFLQQLERIADRLHHRRVQSGYTDPEGRLKRRVRDLHILKETLNKFGGAPPSMLERAVEWAGFRRHLEMDEPFSAWDKQTVTTGRIVQELHYMEEMLFLTRPRSYPIHPS